MNNSVQVGSATPQEAIVNLWTFLLRGSGIQLILSEGRTHNCRTIKTLGGNSQIMGHKSQQINS